MNAKDEFIGGYLEIAMKDYRLPFGLRYYYLLDEKTEEAEKALDRLKEKG